MLDWKQWRKATGLTQDAVIELMQLRGFSWYQSTLYKVESGKRDVTFLEGLRLCAIYDIDIFEKVKEEITNG